MNIKRAIAMIIAVVCLDIFIAALIIAHVQPVHKGTLFSYLCCAGIITVHNIVLLNFMYALVRK